MNKMFKGKLVIVLGVLIKIARILIEITPDVIVEKMSYHMQTNKKERMKKSKLK